MPEQVYYLIPQDLIGYQRRSSRTNVIVSIPDENLLNYTDTTSNCRIKIRLTTLNPTQRDLLMENFSIKVIPFQLAFEVTITSPVEHSRTTINLESDLRQYLIFSIILANKDLRIQFCDNNPFMLSDFTDVGGNGQGVFLPYSFIKLTPEGKINTYYQSDYDRTVIFSNRYFSILEPTKIAELRKLLDKFIVQHIRNIKEPTIEMFIHCHTFSWVPKGLFYPAVVTLASCFDSLLGKQGRISLFNTDPLLTKFQSLRNAISYLDGHDISFNDGTYSSTQYINQNGQQVSPPEVTYFSIDELEEVRKELIHQILLKI
ncbi:MAG: hypothetical protein ACTSUP_02860 [Candidatus Heimdallarchaeaceae archaeon]